MGNGLEKKELDLCKKIFHICSKCLLHGFIEIHSQEMVITVS